MELVIIFVIIFVIYGAGWIWQTINDIVRDINRSNWDNRVYGQVASARAVKRMLGGHDLAALVGAWQRFAESREGSLQDRAPFESPKVAYVFRTSRVLVSIYESGDQPPQFYTQVTYTIAPGWPYRVEIFPQRHDTEDTRFLNIEDLEIGDKVFDDRYVLKSNDANFLREYFDEGTKQAVDGLRAALGNDKILISINSSRLMVRKQGIIAPQEELARFVVEADRVYDRLMFFWQRAAGIEIIDDGPEDPSRCPVCPICGVEIPAEGRVFCRRCKTPHHTDCWSFNDGCATYACGEKKFVKKY